jgi:ATP-dependent DNA helicase PIF1
VWLLQSRLLNIIVSKLNRQDSTAQDPKVVVATAVTASTGVAALHIGGQTIHSWAGIGFGDKDVKALINDIQSKSFVMKRWQNTRALVIDEISMIDADMWDKLEEIARVIRRNSQPFGGIQLTVSGDFLQLPPVVRHQSNQFAQPPIRFCFEAKSWSSCLPNKVELTKVYRQTDPTLIQYV